MLDRTNSDRQLNQTRHPPKNICTGCLFQSAYVVANHQKQETPTQEGLRRTFLPAGGEESPTRSAAPAASTHLLTPTPPAPVMEPRPGRSGLHHVETTHFYLRWVPIINPCYGKPGLKLFLISSCIFKRWSLEGGGRKTHQTGLSVAAFRSCCFFFFFFLAKPCGRHARITATPSEQPCVMR